VTGLLGKNGVTRKVTVSLGPGALEEKKKGAGDGVIGGRGT